MPYRASRQNAGSVSLHAIEPTRSNEQSLTPGSFDVDLLSLPVSVRSYPLSNVIVDHFDHTVLLNFNNAINAFRGVYAARFLRYVPGRVQPIIELSGSFISLRSTVDGAEVALRVIPFFGLVKAVNVSPLTIFYPRLITASPLDAVQLDFSERIIISPEIGATVDDSEYVAVAVGILIANLDTNTSQTFPRVHGNFSARRDIKDLSVYESTL